jgi:hypothetical protein
MNRAKLKLMKQRRKDVWVSSQKDIKIRESPHTLLLRANRLVFQIWEYKAVMMMCRNGFIELGMEISGKRRWESMARAADLYCCES